MILSLIWRSSLLSTLVLLLLVLIADRNIHGASPAGTGRHGIDSSIKGTGGGSICDFAASQFSGCRDLMMNINTRSDLPPPTLFDPCGQIGIYCDDRSHVVGIHILESSSISSLESIPLSIKDEYPSLLWLRIDVPVKNIYSSGSSSNIELLMIDGRVP